jgi:hypothetical protein
MHFIKLATTHYETNGARPAIGADDIWINLDQVVSIEEHLGSNSFDPTVHAGHAPVEHYPCVQITTADGHQHLVPLGTYADQLEALEAINNFIPLLVAGPADVLYGMPTRPASSLI